MLNLPFFQRFEAALIDGVTSAAPPGEPHRAKPPAASEGVDAAAPVEAEATLLDAESLRRLQELDPTGANKLLERIFATFEASALRLLPQLHESQKNDDRAGVRHVAHTLKSSSASIGALKLSALCAEIETMVRQQNPENLGSRVDMLDREIHSVLRALKSFGGTAS
ncbi:MAG: Hpt domain-containing protein [Caldimonas sp.]